jgi:regulator of RNase E activity RraB
MAMKIEPVDPARLAAEMEADADVLKALAANGDISTIARPVDLHFKGKQELIVALGDDADELGFEFVQFNEHEDGEWSVDFTLSSTIEPQVLAQLTERALEIEAAYGVDYDGWGCVAQTGPSN